MGRCDAVAAGTPGSTSRLVRRIVLGALVAVSTATAVSSAGIADATCTSAGGSGPDVRCPNAPTSFAVNLDKNASVSAQGHLDGTAASGGKTAAGASATPSPGPTVVDAASATGSPVTVGESMLGTDAFGAYGSEDFVDAAYGRTTATGMGHDQARNFYQSLADRGLDHHDMPIPRGALAFSAGPDGDHVDISRGDGTYVSGGVQGISPGYGDGHDVQILPSPNLGSWTLYGWAYPDW